VIMHAYTIGERVRSEDSHRHQPPTWHDYGGLCVSGVFWLIWLMLLDRTRGTVYAHPGYDTVPMGWSP
jgi:hypothetical protein